MDSVAERHLDWEGAFNVRDLGGLPTADGRETRCRALVRADSLDGLTAAGWAALSTHGVRTVVDLRNEDELGPDAAPRPSTVTTIHVPLDVSEDREFWETWGSGPQFATPLYYRPHLERFPGRSAAVIAAIADAGPGGVAFHCAGGRDRTGQVAMLLLTLAGVPAEHIAADYALSAERLRLRYAARGEKDESPLLEAFLAGEGTTARDVIVDILGALDVEAHLRASGLSDRWLDAVRTRLLGPRDGGGPRRSFMG
jgi:protein-tyrosine phosphatase